METGKNNEYLAQIASYEQKIHKLLLNSDQQQARVKELLEHNQTQTTEHDKQITAYNQELSKLSDSLRNRVEQCNSLERRLRESAELAHVVKDYESRLTSMSH